MKTMMVLLAILFTLAAVGCKHAPTKSDRQEQRERIKEHREFDR
jgi:hypothetical protein